jgi:alpha-mannosidase
VDFETEVDWHERGSAHADAPMLRATFAPYLGPTDATFEIPFAGLQRPADGREVPALRWADVSEREASQRGGLSLLNDCKYGHQAHGNTLGLTLVRASYEPDVNPDEGLHRFTYALYPHAGDWRGAGTERQAAGLNQPLLAVVTDGHGGILRPGQPGVTCDAPGAMISALKLAEDQPAGGDAVIVRVYESHGQAGEAALRAAWPIQDAAEVNLIEQPETPLAQDDRGVVLPLRAHEIKTARLIL